MTAFGGMAEPWPTGCGAAAEAAGRRDPQDTQNRLATGLRVEQVAQMGPSSSRDSKLKAGASGRSRPPAAGSALYSPGSGTTPRPTGGVGGTSPAGDARRRPQSWQNARFSGLLRPQRSQITSPKGNPQDTGTSSTFQCLRLGRADDHAVLHAHRHAPAEALAPRQNARVDVPRQTPFAPIVGGSLGNPLTSPRSFA